MGRLRHLKYEDFELKIERRSDGYAARVLRSPMGEAATTFTLPLVRRPPWNCSWSGSVMRGAAPGASWTRGNRRRARTRGASSLRRFSREKCAPRCGASLDEAARQDEMGLRLKLRFQDTPELADLPWSFSLRLLARTLLRAIEPDPGRPVS
jgi:hypothetical protein